MKELLSEIDVQCLILDLKNEIIDNPDLPSYSMQKVDEKTLEVRLLKHQSLNDLFQQLSGLDIEVLSVRNKSNRLEQLFMDLVKNQ